MAQVTKTFCTGGSDYTAVLEVLSFDGEITSHGVLINVVPDGLVERTEFFTLNIELINTNTNVQLLQNESIVTIFDQDGMWARYMVV